jgi:hypothetical protein
LTLIWPLPFPVDLVTDMPTEKSLRSSSVHKSGSSSYRDGKQIWIKRFGKTKDLDLLDMIFTKWLFLPTVLK